MSKLHPAILSSLRNPVVRSKISGVDPPRLSELNRILPVNKLNSKAHLNGELNRQSSVAFLADKKMAMSSLRISGTLMHSNKDIATDVTYYEEAIDNTGYILAISCLKRCSETSTR